MKASFDRIHWFQGWIIIVMIFAGISMLVHYENRSSDEAREYYKRSFAERAEILARLNEVKSKLTVVPADVMAKVNMIGERQDAIADALSTENREMWLLHTLKKWNVTVRKDRP